MNYESSPQEWLLQLSDPSTWQNWLTNLVGPDADLPTDGQLVDPEAMTALQTDYVAEMASLWQDALASKTPELHDRRFATSAWLENPMHAFNAAAYLLNSRYLLALADAVQAQPKVKHKIKFAVQQAVDAMSPANFLATNPEAQQKLLETGGESLTKGMMNMLTDMQKGRISQTDESAFEVGGNVAITEGAVVYENPVFQLIQYRPLTRTVYARPLLIVPPCINKFYILDLQPDNSLVRYAVEQGHTVFMVSWVNPDESLATLTWDDYITNGVLQAIETVRDITDQDRINALGFCIGGTMLAMGAAILEGRGDRAFSSLTLLTTLLDYEDAGALDVFIDENQVQARESTIGASGLMPGRDFITAFSSLRPNDLIWNYVQSNYLKGQAPKPFDLLFWNADGTNLPGPMFCWYLRNLYLEDKLKTPGALTIGGEKVDLGNIEAPTFIYASREDHIVPWNSAYVSAALLSRRLPGRVQFVLGASGHIAGVINPAGKNKRNYWTGAFNPKSTPAQWLEKAVEKPGSWWPEWADFLAQHAGAEVKAPRRYGNARFEPIEHAPGRYVQAKMV